MPFETKHCIYFCIDSSHFQNLPRYRNGQGKGSSAGGEEVAATREAFSISDSAPLGLAGPNSLLDESHVCSKRTIWGKLCPDTTITTSDPVMDFTGISIKTFFAFLCLYLHTKMFMSMYAFPSWPTTEKGKKRKKREWRWQHLLFLYKFLLEIPSSR